MNDNPVQIAGALFEAVQQARIFPDSKTFPDCRARVDAESINDAYLRMLRDFVAEHFELPAGAGRRSRWRRPIRSRPTSTACGQSSSARPIRPRRAAARSRSPTLTWCLAGASARSTTGTATSPPGARGVGPAGSGRRHDPQLRGPHRSLRLRAQRHPAVLPRALAAADVLRHAAAARALPGLRGGAPLPAAAGTRARLLDGCPAAAPSAARGPRAAARVVEITPGAVLNRYWDANDTPRPESFGEDLHTCAGRRAAPRRHLPRHPRGRRVGLGFQQPLSAPNGGIESICCSELLPVDLNALLWQLEHQLAAWLELGRRRARGRPCRRRRAGVGRWC